MAGYDIDVVAISLTSEASCHRFGRISKWINGTSYITCTFKGEGTCRNLYFKL